MVELKPALTYEQQIDLLRSKHALSVPDNNEAVRILSSVNYYRLSAYGIGLRRPDNLELFRDGVSLTTLFRLYSFDSQFRNAIFLPIEQIEIKLRTQIAYHLGLQYGPDGYSVKTNFEQKVKCINGKDIIVHDRIMEKFHAEVYQQRELPCVKHHIEKYEGRFPVWAAVELFSFGSLGELFSIMKPDDQRDISDLYNVQPWYLKSWIVSLIELRNRCAHYGRIYNMPLKSTPRLFPEVAIYRSNRVFPIILVFKHMMGNNSSWQTFLSTLVGLLEEYTEVNLKYIGFPDNWKELLG